MNVTFEHTDITSKTMTAIRKAGGKVSKIVDGAMITFPVGTNVNPGTARASGTRDEVVTYNVYTLPDGTSITYREDQGLYVNSTPVTWS